jgi:hypothetical protein
VITEQRFAFAWLRRGACPTTSGSSHHCAPDGRILGTPPTSRAAAARYRHDWSAGAGGRTAGTDPNASAAIDRVHHDRATHLPVERPGTLRAEADQS